MKKKTICIIYGLCRKCLLNFIFCQNRLVLPAYLYFEFPIFAEINFIYFRNSTQIYTEKSKTIAPKKSWKFHSLCQTVHETHNLYNYKKNSYTNYVFVIRLDNIIQIGMPIKRNKTFVVSSSILILDILVLSRNVCGLSTSDTTFSQSSP